MVRTQLYLPDETYKFAKQQAKECGMSFAAYTRLLYDKEKDLKAKPKNIEERFPFLKYAGTFHLGANASHDIDSIYDLI